MEFKLYTTKPPTMSSNINIYFYFTCNLQSQVIYLFIYFYILLGISIFYSYRGGGVERMDWKTGSSTSVPRKLFKNKVLWIF